jgi:hypothetical protein
VAWGGNRIEAVDPAHTSKERPLAVAAESRVRLVNERFASDFLSLSVPYLRKSRSKNATVDGPAWVKCGKAVRYDPRDLERYIELHRVGGDAR